MLSPQSKQVLKSQDEAFKSDLQRVYLEHNRCQACDGVLRQKDCDLVCVECGLVAEKILGLDEYIPFDENSQSKDFESHFSPPNQLAFNKGLGTSQFLSKASHCRILSAVNTEDLGLRARHVRTITAKTEHPWIIDLLNYGSQICKQFDFHRKKDSYARFSNRYGKVLRSLGAYIIIRGKHWNELKQTARATFIVLYRDFVGKDRAEEARRQMGISPFFMKQVEFLVDTIGPRRSAC